MQLKIIVPGPYNDEKHQVDTYTEGDVLTTSAYYGESLVMAGLADYIVEEVTSEETEETGKETKKETPKTPVIVDRRRRGNAFTPKV